MKFLSLRPSTSLLQVYYVFSGQIMYYVKMYFVTTQVPVGYYQFKVDILVYFLIYLKVEPIALHSFDTHPRGHLSMKDSPSLNFLARIL